jgi:S-adenosylmethionine:tRNA ribosyltransferase-isomerase
MLTRLFDFELPPSLIALRQVEPREKASLMVIRANNRFEHRKFKDLGDYLSECDILPPDVSKVISVRLNGTRLARDPSGQQVPIEITLHRRTGGNSFLALAKPARRVRPNDFSEFGPDLGA